MTTIDAGAFTFYPYGLALAAGALASLLLMRLLSRGHRLKAETASWFGLFAVPLAVLCGRILYFLVSLPWFIDRGAETFFHFTEGGYMLYGTMAGIVLAAWLTGRITHQGTARILDGAAAPFALFTAAARCAESLAGVGLGEYIEEWFDPMFGRSMIELEDSSFFQRFPFGVLDADELWRFPVFLLEAIAAVVFLILLLRIRTRRDGTKALLFLGLYAALQTFLESIRIDLELRWGFVKINQLLALPAMALIIAICILRTPREERSFRRFAAPSAGILLCCGIIMAMEFALESKIKFLTWMRMDLCWMVMLAAAVCMAVCACRLIMKTDRCGKD